VARESAKISAQAFSIRAMPCTAPMVGRPAYSPRSPSFLLGMAAGQPVPGPLSDRYGRRTPILVGAGMCTAATALCALAPSLGVLVAVRFVMGFSGAAGVVVGRAVIADVADGALERSSSAC
jgi:MFS family permease